MFTGAPEFCDSLDSNCNGSLVDSFPNYDGDAQPDCIDADDDNDGDPDATDCGPTDALIYTGAIEACDLIDSDCDGSLVDEFTDTDGDGTPDCADNDSDNDGFSSVAGDCDDTDATMYPGAPELCDTIDSDCDGSLVDEFDNFDGDSEPNCIDADDDNDGDPDASDCEDADASIFTGALEVCSDGIDQNCDLLDLPCNDLCDDTEVILEGQTLAGFTDGGTLDSTPFPTCPGNTTAPGVWYSYTATGGDVTATTCAATGFDTKISVFSGTCAAPVCVGGNDDDCTQYAFASTVTWDSTVGETYLILVHGYQQQAGDFELTVTEPNADADDDGDPDITDCNDADATIYTGAVELCDGVDQDCDGVLDNGFDVDGDGVTTCAGDCDDTNALTFPAAPEVCDGEDNDCDGALPLIEVDNDSDGVTECNGDCDDTDIAISPFAFEVCNGVDDNCEGTIDEGFDADGDTYTICANDCDDTDASINPGATEVCNLVDDDCDSTIDEGFDVDGDGYTSCGDDCDDTNASINPLGTEVCDGVDDDCDGTIDNGFDLDGDGYTSCGGDCDDADAATYPTATELCDGIDNDCDGIVPGVEVDDDGDSFTDCGGDCDDTDIAIYPGAAEACNALDDDCDGTADFSTSAGTAATPIGTNSFTGSSRIRGDVITVAAASYLDSMGFEITAAAGTTVTFAVWEGPTLTGSKSMVTSNEVVITDPARHFEPSGFLGVVLVPGTYYAVGVHVSASETMTYHYDGVLLGSIGAGVTTESGLAYGVSSLPDPLNHSSTPTSYNMTFDLTAVSEADGDADGYLGCADDCDDASSAINPLATEVCNSIDEDCDGQTDNGFDADGDSYTSCGGDCDDTDASVSPLGTETCNGVDDNCDGTIDDGFDVDNDTYTTCAGDCNDADPTVNPGVAEACNAVDDDCDGAVDEGFDVDNDSYTTCNGDCDDTDPLINPLGTEACDGVDEDCDGVIDNGFDLDGDSYTSCGGDCDDGDAATYPGATELCDGVDNDCDGSVPSNEVDGDLDGVTGCAGDCDELDGSVYPGAPEACNGNDDDCNGSADLLTAAGTGATPIGPSSSSGPGRLRGNIITVDSTSYLDSMALEMTVASGDTVTFAVWEGPTQTGVKSLVVSRAVTITDASRHFEPSGWLGVLLEPGTYYAVGVHAASPNSLGYHYGSGLLGSIGGGVTTVSGLGQNLAALPDPLNNSTTSLSYNMTFDLTAVDELDGDTDGSLGCADDCDDTDATFSPTAPELCDVLDNDCDGIIPSDEIDDGDSDGSIDCADCEPADASIYPGAPETCDGVDEDCNGSADFTTVAESAETDTTGETSFTNNSRVRGNILSVASETMLESMTFGLDAAVGSLVTMAVWEGTSATGSFDLVASRDVYVSAAGRHLEPSGALNVLLVPGMYYAAGAHIPESSSATYYPGPTGTTPVALTPNVTIEGAISENSLALLPDPITETGGPSRPMHMGFVFSATDEVDGDGDGYLGCGTDCDDEVASVNPVGVEVCDGLDDDCDGVVGTTYTPSIDPTNNTGTGTNQFRGDKVLISSPVTLDYWQQRVQGTAGDTLTWSVHEGVTETGTFNEIFNATTTLTSSDEIFHPSPTAGLELQSGMYYVLGVSWTASTSYTYGSMSFPIASDFGSVVAGAADNSAPPAASQTFSNELNGYGIILHGTVPDDCGGDIAVSGGNLAIQGSIDATDPLWARPSASCSPQWPADHYYDAFAITNHTGAAQSVDITAVWLGDGYLHVYSHPLDTSNTTGCVTGNDDFYIAPGPPTLASQIAGHPIAAGETLHVIASTYTGGQAIGAYFIDVTTN